MALSMSKIKGGSWIDKERHPIVKDSFQDYSDQIINKRGFNIIWIKHKKKWNGVRKMDFYSDHAMILPTAVPRFFQNSTKWFFPKDNWGLLSSGYLQDRYRLVGGEIEVYFKDGSIYEGKFKKHTIKYKRPPSTGDNNIYYKIEVVPNGHGSFAWGKGRTNEHGELVTVETHRRPNKGYYIGNWKNGYMHGKGTLVMGPGQEYLVSETSTHRTTLYRRCTYNGMWEYDKKHGIGTATLPNGEKYEGNWVNDQINGQGTFTWTNGEKYEGNWVNNQRNGKGSMTYADGSKYVGEWVDDQINGHGTMTYADGRVYDGEWADGKENGKGIMIYPDGTKYEGTWKDGESEHLNERSCDKKSCETSIYPVLEPQPRSYEPSAPPLPAQEEHTCECVICMDGEANYACIPCGHKCLCSSSACSSVKNCPICRQEVTGTYRIF